MSERKGLVPAQGVAKEQKWPRLAKRLVRLRNEPLHVARHCLGTNSTIFRRRMVEDELICEAEGSRGCEPAHQKLAAATRLHAPRIEADQGGS